MMRKIIALILGAMLCYGCETKDTENFLLKPKDFQTKVISDSSGVLLDVRTPEEVQSGYLKGAVNIDFNTPEFNILVAGMDKTKPYFVYCASGVRSGKAAEKMRDLDFQKVYTLEGGINAWKADGLPLQIPKATN